MPGRLSDWTTDFKISSQPLGFIPPEELGSALDSFEEDWVGVSEMSSWDIATRYHEFKQKPVYQKIGEHLREISAHSILERAQEVLGSVVHPQEKRVSPADTLPFDAELVEFDLEETLENSPHLHRQAWIEPADIFMEYSLRRRQSIVLSVDTSLSMTGEKLALTAVALAVVLLQFPDDPIGIVAFENQARVLKDPFERLTVFELVQRFLDVPAQGYTHLELGVKKALSLCRSIEGQIPGRPPAALLLTDGKYTAGRDPAYLAPRFSQLSVLKMGDERASLPLCREMAHRGRGSLCEVPRLDALPLVMYSVVKDLLRGRK